MRVYVQHSGCQSVRNFVAFYLEMTTFRCINFTGKVKFRECTIPSGPRSPGYTQGGHFSRGHVALSRGMHRLPGASPGTDKGLQEAGLEFRSKGVPRWLRRDPRVALYVSRMRSLLSSAPSSRSFLSFPAFPASQWTIVLYVICGFAWLLYIYVCLRSKSKFWTRARGTREFFVWQLEIYLGHRDSVTN